MSGPEKKIALEKTKDLKPGDMILIQTPDKLYDLFRKLGDHNYDHIVSDSIAVMIIKLFQLLGRSN